MVSSKLRTSYRKRRLGHRPDHGFVLADGATKDEFDIRISHPQRLHHFRQLFLQMPAAGYEHGQHDNFSGVLLDQLDDCIGQGRRHEFEKGQFDRHVDYPLANRRLDTAHRIGPFRVASTVGEEDKRSRHGNYSVH